LTGADPRTGKDFSHRKHWLEDRVKTLTGVFAVESLDITILDNHLHLILRNRPDIVATWSDEEVARRWLRLHRQLLQLLAPASDKRVRQFLKDKKKLLEARMRLSSISWFMAYLKEPISRAANEEDDASGAFWAGRFWCALLPNNDALLACSLYVNMNPIRAGIAKRPEDAQFTSVFERIRDRVSGDPNLPHSGWLAPVHLNGDGYAGAAARRRPSDVGYLELTFEQYLELLDAVIRREAAERAGGVWEEYPPILERLGITAPGWETALRRMNRRFARELEKSQKLLDEMRDRRQGPRPS
jgi:REP element-mobilizing transposase RayT